MKFVGWLGLTLVLVGGAAGALSYFRQTPSSTPPPAEREPPWFRDATREFGLDFVHDPGPVGDAFLPQIMGSGGAVLDFDRDGRLDLYLLNMGGSASSTTNRLFRQLPGGRFQDVTVGSGLGLGGISIGVAVGDVNNDGWPDLVVTQYGGIKLFLNTGNGTFHDGTDQAGLKNPAWGTSAAFVDYDRDGWLDLIVVNYVDYDPTLPCPTPQGKKEYCNPKHFAGTVARLFHNLGPGKTGTIQFEDVSLASGIGRLPGPGLGVVCADFDGDGWPDIFVANDGQPNRLWINRRNGTFTEEAALRGVAYTVMGQAFAGMGVAWGDVDGDGLFDLFVTHYTTETHTLWKQGPRGLFQDRTGGAGLTRPRWQGTGFGTALADFNHDGALDLALVNGYVAAADTNANPDLGPHFGFYADRHQLLTNDGQGRFKDISLDNPEFSQIPDIGRGLLRADLDQDGALDLIVTSVAGPAKIYRNVVPERGQWLMVQALVPSPLDPDNAAMDRDALGAEITVRAGGKSWTRLVQAADSYLSSSDPRCHFGLGSLAAVDRIEVLWPDGSRETFPGTKANQLVSLRKGQGRLGE